MKPDLAAGLCPGVRSGITPKWHQGSWAVEMLLGRLAFLGIDIYTGSCTLPAARSGGCQRCPVFSQVDGASEQGTGVLIG